MTSTPPPKEPATRRWSPGSSAPRSVELVTTLMLSMEIVEWWDRGAYAHAVFCLSSTVEAIPIPTTLTKSLTTSTPYSTRDGHVTGDIYVDPLR